MTCRPSDRGMIGAFEPVPEYGLDSALVQDIISETGVDMSKWKTSKHFSSWLRLCPYNDISGGKALKSKTGETTNRANLAFRLAARSAGKSDSAMKRNTASGY